MTDKEQTVINDAKAYITALFSGESSGHDAAHTLRVFRNAGLLYNETLRTGECGGAREFTVLLAALLHDADDPKLFDTENNANARGFLAAHGVDGETAERVISAINAVSFSKNRDRAPSTPEGMIVRDADRLDAIGAVGAARTFAYGGAHGRSLEKSTEHFYEKLLLLKDMMLTRAARELAEERHAFMELFLAQLRRETGEPEPKK